MFNIRGEQTTWDAVATAHSFVRKINKTPVLLRDGSAGFLVNAGLASYFQAADDLYREGTPVAVVDEAMRKTVFPMGPFELADQAGVDIAAGMFDTMAAEQVPARPPLVWQLRDVKRFGVTAGPGFYDYEKGKKQGEWAGLSGLVAGRGARVASADEIVERCVRALYATARALCDRQIVDWEEECDLAFVLGIGFAMHLARRRARRGRGRRARGARRHAGRAARGSPRAAAQRRCRAQPRDRGPGRSGHGHGAHGRVARGGGR